jgi:large repetitive protein
MSNTTKYTSDDRDGCSDTDSAPKRDGIVTGTVGNDYMDDRFTGDPDGDKVDNWDAILPGAQPNDDVIKAGAGNDTVLAGGQNDLVYAGTGNDYVDAGIGNDTIYGGDGADTVWAKEGEDLIFGGKGNDYLKGGLDDDTIHGDEGDDALFGGNAGTVPGNDGEDVLYGGTGNDSLSGYTGDDSLYGGDGRDSAEGGEGNDLIDTSGGVIPVKCGPDGLPLPDRGYPGLYPGDSDPFNDRDTVLGGDGNDTIRTGDDNDLVYGGSGNDSVDGGFDDDTIHGDTGNDTIIGAEGSDSISGGDGEDLIYGGYGPGVPDAVNIPDDAGDLRPDNGRDTIDAGSGNDTVYGLDDADSISGGSGNDMLDGGIDNDTVAGGDGNDTIIGGQGLDSLFGGADRDSIDGGLGDVVDGGTSGDDFDTLNLTGVVPSGGRVELVDVTVDADGDSTSGTAIIRDASDVEIGRVVFTEIEEIIPCFTPGALIATPRGEVPVESLREGDKVITRDNGIQEIRWIGQKHMGWAELTANPHLKPVLVRQGSLGNGLPERDMLVSPNHRLLVANDRTSLYFDEHEVLVAAKHLVGGAGIQSLDSVGTTYIHFMFDQHEIVLSDGAWTESFQPGDYTLKGIGNAQRSEILELFPELKTEAGIENYVAARRTLKRHEARLLMR